MASRTTLVLDDKAREAARQLARRHGCSLSEATRRALVRQRDAEMGVPRRRRRERVLALRRLFDLFAENDPRAEIRRLKAEDDGFSPRKRAADVAIGVTAAVDDAVLVTRNARDFAGIPDLRVEAAGPSSRSDRG